MLWDCSTGWESKEGHQSGAPVTRSCLRPRETQGQTNSKRQWKSEWGLNLRLMSLGFMQDPTRSHPSFDVGKRRLWKFQEDCLSRIQHIADM